MKKLLVGLVLATTFFTLNVYANEAEKVIPVSQVEVLLGIITESNSPEYTYISTLDGNGWAMDYDKEFATDAKVILVFDNMGTLDIYDDEIIQVVKIK